MKNKYAMITLSVASIFMITQNVLINATVVPQLTDNPLRYYLYYFAKAISIVGLNLIPLSLGYYSSVIQKRNIIKKLGNFYLVYFTIAMICNLFFFVLRSQMNIRDLWIVLFPISQNYFTFSVSCMLGLLLIPKAIDKLEKQSDFTIKQIISLLSMLFIVFPTIFSKDLWGFQDGKNVLWVLYLILLGYALKRLNSFKRFKNNYIHLFFSFTILLISIVLMSNVSQTVHGNTTTAFRFCIPFSITSMYFTISLFYQLEEKFQNFFKIRISLQSMATYMIVIQVILNLPVVNYVVGSIYKKDFPDSGKEWLFQIGLLVLIYLLTAIVLTVLSLLLQKTSTFSHFEKVLSFSSYYDFMEKLSVVYQWLYNCRKIIFVALFFYIFSICQFLFSSKDELNISNFLKQLIVIISESQYTLLLTVFIIILFFMLLFLLTNRFWYSFTVTLTIDILLTISTVLKITLREEPVLPSDLKMLNGISEILNMINPIIIFMTIISLLFLIISTLIIQRKAKDIYFLKINKRKRYIYIVAILFAFSSIIFVNHKNSPSYLIMNLFNVNKTFFNQKDAVKTNGPIIQFLINVDVDIMEKPGEYSESKVKDVMKKYEARAKEINLRRKDWSNDQTFIFCLSESFSDPSRVPNLSIKSNPITYIKKLQKENTGGVMMSVGYGGGTANMEWESLTGLNISNLSETLVTPYTQLVDKQKISPNISNLFQEKIAIHPFTASLYKRKDVFEKFGFQKFYYEGSPNKLEYKEKIDNSPRVSDEAAFNETLKHINENTNKTQFIQLSTMQNHMPYSDYYSINNFDYDGSAVPTEREQELKTYMQGINYTDIAVKKFIAELEKIEKPITFVFYGDHLPSIYSGLKMSQFGLELHQTDYFIYSNKYSREQSKVLNKKVISTNDFPAMALEQSNIKITPYYALLTEVANKLPAGTIDPYNSVSNRYNGSQVFVSEDNSILSEKDFDEEQTELFKDFKLIQYDLTAGKQYSAKWASQGNYKY